MSSKTPKDWTMHCEQWGVPNWEIAEEYSYVKNLPRDHIRWEFLRRDEGYRKLKQKKNPYHFRLGRYISPDTRADELPDDFVFADTIRRGEGLALQPPPVSGLLFKKGDKYSENKVDAYLGLQIRELQDSNYIIAAFDPFYSIPAQIKIIKRKLVDAQNDITSQAPELLSAGSKRQITLREVPKLLRALDARYEDVTFDEIGQKIFLAQDISSSGPTAAEAYERAKLYWKLL